MTDHAAAGLGVRDVDGSQAATRALLLAVGPSQSLPLAARLPEELHWGGLLLLAGAHRVLPLLHRALVGQEDLLPAPSSARLRRYWEGLQRSAREQAQELLRLRDELAAVGVEATPYKGPALALQAYGHLALRQARDLDLLIRPADASAAATVLWSCGYTRVAEEGRPGEYHACFLDEAKRMVELHWGFARRLHSFSLPLEPLWKRRVPVEILGRTVPALSPEDTLLLLAVHAAKHDWDRLVYVADVAWLLHRSPELDGAAALSRAAEARCLRVLLVALRLAADLLEVPLPEPLASAAAADPVAGQLATEYAAKLFSAAPSPGWEIALRMTRLREDWRDGVTYPVALVRQKLGIR